MAKIEVVANDVREQINALESYRSGWANDIREGWDFATPETKKVLFELYEVSGNIILALQNILKGCYRDKMAMLLTLDKLQALNKSEEFDNLSILSEAGLSNVITNGTRHHIKIMFECLQVLTV